MKSRRESGEVVVEASIVVTLVMIIITIMMYVGMILYQQTLVSVMANQTAANIAQVYGNNLKDPFSGYVDPERVYQSITYSNMKTDAYMTVVEQKANIFAQYRLKSSRILANGNTSVEVDVVKKPNELLKSQIIVTIRDHYDVPLVGFFGTSGLVEFASSGRADCVDILEYINGVEAIGDPETSNVSVLPDTKRCTVAFVADPDEPDKYTMETVLKGHSIMSSNKYTHCVMPTNPQKGDLQYVGWYTAEGRAFLATDSVEQDMVVYARYQCTVILDANGGTFSGGSATQTKYVVYGNRTSFTVPSRNGYNFLGWFDAQGNEYCSNDTPISANVTLMAKWERRIHKVTYDPCGGSLPKGVSKTVTVVYNETVSLPGAKRSGYTFSGWYDADGKAYTSSTKITADITLYARWKTCTKHRNGDCGVDHAVNYSFTFHNRPYYGSVKVRCIVCPDCGCLMDGNGKKSNVELKRRYGSVDKINSAVWCSVHKTSSGGYANDTYVRTASAGTYYIH